MSKSKIVVSLDWDFFVAADRDFRKDNFPNSGAHRWNELTRNRLWKEQYDNNPDLWKVKVKDKEYRTIKEICAAHKGVCMVAESHKDIYEFIMREVPEGEIELWNIDYHHDTYQTGSDILTCGNWVSKLFDTRALEYFWVPDETSDIEGLDTRAKAVSFDYIPTAQEINAIFLCRSDIWTPPHLDAKFGTLAKTLYKRGAIYNNMTRRRIKTPRKA